MGLLNAPMTPKMKADLERMNALRAELEQLETEYADAIRIPGVQRVRNVAFIDTEKVIGDSDYDIDSGRLRMIMLRISIAFLVSLTLKMVLRLIPFLNRFVRLGKFTKSSKILLNSKSSSV